MRLRSGSLRGRLVLAALAAVTMALVVAGLAIGVILTRFLRGQIDGRLDAQITALRAGLEAGTALVERLGADALLVDRHGGLHRTAGFDRFELPRTKEAIA